MREEKKKQILLMKDQTKRQTFKATKVSKAQLQMK